MKPYTQILSDYLSDLKYEDIPEEVIERAKLLTFHVIGVTLSVTKSEQAKRLIEQSKLLKSDNQLATVIGDGTKVPVASAAMVNGSMADLLDWEDCSWTGHPSAGAVPAGLAMAEAYNKSGKDYLTALVGGYDVYQRIAMAVQPSLERFRKGWGLYAWQIFAPATVAGKLYGLEGKKMNQLLGTSVAYTPICTHHVNRSNTDYYHLMHGLSAKLSIENIHLIDQVGISSLTDTLESYGGYYQGVSDQCDWDWFDKDLGKEFLIMETLFKHWPANMWIQTPLDMLDEIVTKNNIKADDIKEVMLNPFIPRRSEPIDVEELKQQGLLKAQFNIPWCLSMYLKGPKPGYEWTEEKYLSDPEIIDMSRKIVGGDETEYIPVLFNKFRDRSFQEYKMTVTTNDGTVHKIEQQYPMGHPKNMYTREECIKTFKLATKGILSEKRADEVADLILNKFETIEDMSTISEFLKSDL